jgi:hypothetical protein
MAEPYFERLSQIVNGCKPLWAGGVTLDTRHFFSGEALYANGKICASLSPAGFAVKLPSEIRQSLINDGDGKEFRFFTRGPIKREYVALSERVLQDDETLGKLIGLSVGFAVGAPGSSASAEV